MRCRSRRGARLSRMGEDTPLIRRIGFIDRRHIVSYADTPGRRRGLPIVTPPESIYRVRLMQLTPRFLAYATAGECFRKYFTRPTRQADDGSVVVWRPSPRRFPTFARLRARRYRVEGTIPGATGRKRGESATSSRHINNRTVT